jgi:hypothetical protein
MTGQTRQLGSIQEYIQLYPFQDLSFDQAGSDLLF